MGQVCRPCPETSQVRYLLEAIEHKLAYTRGRAPKLDEADRAERQAALQNIMDKLLAATVPEHLPRHGRYAVDASAIGSAARGKRRLRATDPAVAAARGVDGADGEVTDDDIAARVEEAGRSHDPDAQWGYRTKTFDNRTTSCFGYQLVAFTRMQPVGWDTDEPLLTEGIEHCPLSMLMPDSVPELAGAPDAVTAPAACLQRTVTVPGDVTPEVRQRLRWGSPEWVTSFKRRTLVEGAFGNLKNPHTENVRRGWTNVVGIVKTSLMLVIAQAAANLRLLRVWARRTGDYTDPLTLPDPEDHGFEEIDPTAGTLGPNAPPIAA